MSINISEVLNKRMKQLDEYKKEGSFIMNWGHKYNEDGTVKYLDLVFKKNKAEIPFVMKDQLEPGEPAKEPTFRINRL